MLTGNAVQPPETEPAVRDVQPLDLLGQRTDFDISLDECATVATQCRLVAVLHSCPLAVESLVQPGHVDALGLQLVFVVLRCHMPPKSQFLV